MNVPMALHPKIQSMNTEIAYLASNAETTSRRITHLLHQLFQVRRERRQPVLPYRHRKCLKEEEEYIMRGLEKTFDNQQIMGEAIMWTIYNRNALLAQNPAYVQSTASASVSQGQAHQVGGVPVYFPPHQLQQPQQQHHQLHSQHPQYHYQAPQSFPQSEPETALKTAPSSSFSSSSPPFCPSLSPSPSSSPSQSSSPSLPDHTDFEPRQTSSSSSHRACSSTETAESSTSLSRLSTLSIANLDTVDGTADDRQDESVGPDETDPGRSRHKSGGRSQSTSRLVNRLDRSASPQSPRPGPTRRRSVCA